jgi:LysR family transcriptional regulator for bpeEF and oprC
LDKLRALDYFIAAAGEGSFSAAGRRFDVSTPAVARMIGELEKSLGVRLFHRGAQGLSLTSEGAEYLRACRPLLQQLRQVDDSLSGAASRPQGLLVLGAPPYLSQHCILPALPAFHEAYPDLQVEIRSVDLASSPKALEADVLLLFGWQSHGEMVHRRIAQTRSLICASPSYWEKHGVPQRFKDLEQHKCLLFRDQEGTTLDFWEYEKAGKKEGVKVSGWLISDHRDVLLDAALAGAGVGRFSDLTVREHLLSGRLLPVMLDWETRHAPPINLLYRSDPRRVPRVKVFIDFLIGLFEELEADGSPVPTSTVAAEKPYWYKRRRTRASSSPRD